MDFFGYFSAKFGRRLSEKQLPTNEKQLPTNEKQPLTDLVRITSERQGCYIMSLNEKVKKKYPFLAEFEDNTYICE